MVETRYDEQIQTGFSNNPNVTVENVEDTARSWRDAIANKFSQGRDILSSRSRTVADQARNLPRYSRIAAVRVDRYVHARPWVAIGVMSCVAMIGGFFLGRSLRSGARSFLSGIDIDDYT